MTIAQWVYQARLKKELTQTELGEALGRTKQNVYSWEKGLHQPSPDQIKEIMKITGASPPPIFSEIAKLNSINSDNVESTNLPAFKVPLISWVQAGAWAEGNCNAQLCEPDSWINTDTHYEEGTFALIVRGESMTSSTEPSFPDGTIIICCPHIQGSTGDFVIAKDVLNQKTTFKKLTLEGMTYYLSPLNDKFPTIEINNGDIRIIAKVVESIKRNRF